MDLQRKIADCRNCQREAEIAAHGLCYACYRRDERAADNPWAAANKHNKSALKEQRILRKTVNAILNAVDDGIDHFYEKDVEAIRGIVKPYLSRLVDGLPGKSDVVVNSSQRDDVHVHNQEAEVNSEQESDVHVHDRTEPQAGILRLQIPGSQIITVGDSAVLYIEHWLPDPEGWYARCKDIAFSPEELQMFGKPLTLERQTANYGNFYDYNPKAKPAMPWPASGPIADIRKMLEEATGVSFTQCACNLYQHGGVKIGAHQDKRNPSLIASISLGAERTMGFCKIVGKGKDGKIDKDLPLISLAPGSLLLFDAEFNSRYKHAIAEDKSVTEPRISLTYRAFDTATGGGASSIIPFRAPRNSHIPAE